MVMTVSKWFNFVAAGVFFVAAIVAGITLNVTSLTLVALGLWQVAEATK